MRKCAAWAVLAFAAFAAAGCAQLERTSSEKPDFELAARLAARYRNEAFSGNLAFCEILGALREFSIGEVLRYPWKRNTHRFAWYLSATK